VRALPYILYSTKLSSSLDEVPALAFNSASIAVISYCPYRVLSAGRILGEKRYYITSLRLLLLSLGLAGESLAILFIVTGSYPRARTYALLDNHSLSSLRSYVRCWLRITPPFKLREGGRPVLGVL